ncbi:hypothetical protein GQ53DRAFT_839615 [Thozetella sp. PMI_491]|nr:hypothetical protein GQ53DRAFT_839615 [Thozetella sp. PMI_491]
MSKPSACGTDSLDGQVSAERREICEGCNKYKLECYRRQRWCDQCVSHRASRTRQAAVPASRQPLGGAAPVIAPTVEAISAVEPLSQLVQGMQVPPCLDSPIYRGQSLEPNGRMMEKALFSCYTHRIENPDVWANELPKRYFNAALPLGHEYPYLMEAVIGLGAIYRAQEHTRDASTMATIHNYASRCITGQLETLKSGVTHSNFEVLFTCASLIAVQTVLHRMLLPAHPSSLAGLSDWYRAWNGVQSLIKGAPTEFSTSAYAFYPAFCMGQWPSTGRDSPSSGPVFSFLLQRLPRMSTPHKVYAAYKTVVVSLSSIYTRPLRHLHCQLLVDRPREFLKGIERCEPTAMLLVGTHCALTRILDKPFICDESSEADLQLIMANLPRTHKALLQRAIDLIGHKTTRTLQQY